MMKSQASFRCREELDIASRKSGRHCGSVRQDEVILAYFLNFGLL